jgi:hypothetical protein
MKSILARLAPGFFVTLGAIALGFFCMAKAQNKSETPAATPPAASQASNSYAAEAPVQRHQEQLLVCGACGAQLRAPQVVMVAAPVNGERHDYRQSYAPRPAAYATDAYYPEPATTQVVYVEREASPYSYAPAYYGRGYVNEAPCVDPFTEIRVNPIPFYPGQQRARFAIPQHVHRN